LEENMSEHEHEHEHDGIKHIQIPLDGSYGAGPRAEVTIITKAENGDRRRETFEVPYFLIDIPCLMKLNAVNLILGFEIIKGDQTPSGLKDLGII
jgi:hypothetical protein